MRILAIPLTRPVNGHTLTPLVYYHARMPPVQRISPPSRITQYKDKAWEKATTMWADWGKAEGGWKRKTHDYGEKIYDRLDFEEIALKSIDPALGPHLLSQAEGAKVQGALEKGDPLKIPLFYPSQVGPTKPLQHLTQLLDHRGPKHRKWFWIFAIAAPFTAPFALIPVIPNLPFFFCVWRAWSHWKAYKAADYLRKLISLDAVQPTPSPILDEVYATHPPPADSPYLLRRDMLTPLMTKMKLAPDSASDILRAIDQARSRTEKELQKQKSL
ncbi:hypothetical protein FRC03_003838 [Tulasnella sp. 419]|nr:hypothetical protein FRC03_003838 [Tulasnella sp. 419]